MAVIILQGCGVRKATRHSRILIHHISRREIGLDTLRDKEKLARIIEEMVEGILGNMREEVS